MFLRAILITISSVFLFHCMGGSSMKGVSLPNGWLEFKGEEVSHLRPGTHPNTFLLNWGKNFAWAQYDIKKGELKIQSSSFGFDDGSKKDFFGVDWHATTPDYKSFLFYQGRGITLYRSPNSKEPNLEVVDVNFDEGADWMWVNKEFTQAIVPLSPEVGFDDVFNFGGTPLALFQIDLAKNTYTINQMDHFADSYLGPNFLLWRHFAKSTGKGKPAEPTHFTATDFNLVERDVPLVRLLNRYRDSLPDFRRRFYISSQGWAIMGAYSPNSNTGVFLLSPEGNGKISPLLESGTISIPEEALSQCSLSEDGQYFAFFTIFNREYFPSAKGTVVHLGRVEKVDGGFAARIKRIADFNDLSVFPPTWIPGTHALVLNTDPIDHPSLIRIYDLDKHPVDWSKVPLATPAVKAVK